MSLLDRVRECNTFDPLTFLPFRIGGAQVGWVHRGFAPRLDACPGVFVRGPEAVALDPRLAAYGERTAEVDAALRALYDGDAAGFGRWTGEQAPVVLAWDSPALFQIERAAMALFGLAGRGAHLNGFVRDGAGLEVWVARRHRGLASYPGKLDQVAAGFVPAGITPRRKLLVEASEEAGIPAALLRGMRAAGTITYARQADLGLIRGAVHVFDIELPASFEPVNRDGEIEAFHLLPAAEVLALVRDTDNFKFDCALVAIDFLMRHGVIPSSHPEHSALVSELRG